MSEHSAEKGVWVPAFLGESPSNVITADPEGYSIVLCHCEEGPYLGARKAGTPCCCERCGFMTREAWEALARPLASAVHDHPPYRPVCNERDVDGQLRGACLNDDGTSVFPSAKGGPS